MPPYVTVLGNLRKIAGGATGGAAGGPAYVIYKQRPRRRERKADLIFLRRDDVDILNTKIAITLMLKLHNFFIYQNAADANKSDGIVLKAFPS